MQTIGMILIWLLVIALGITVGAGLYESRVVLPSWASSPPPTWLQSGTSFWAYVSTGPLTLFVILGLIFVWRFEGPAKSWWLAALLLCTAERLVTFTYFIPTMASLQSQREMTPDLAESLARWAFLNHGRHILSAMAWLSSLMALSRLGQSRQLG